MNWYTYANNNSIRFTDSTGLDPALDEYVNTNYSGQVTITFVVQQPISGSRQAIDSNFEGEVGHTFVRIDYGYGDVYYYGLYPNDPMTPEQILKNEENVTREIRDDSNHDWNIAEVFVIDRKDADKALSFIQNYNKDYNMVKNNCTTFGVDALKKA